MMLGDNLGIYRLVISDDNPPTRARARRKVICNQESRLILNISLRIGLNFVKLIRVLTLSLSPPWPTLTSGTLQEFPFREYFYHRQVVYIPDYLTGWENA